MTTLQETSCILGKDVILSATLEGIPKPEVKVYKDNVEIFSNENVSIECVNDKSSLTIKKATLEDVGCYRFDAKNVVGTSSTEGHLRMIGRT